MINEKLNIEEQIETGVYKEKVKCSYCGRYLTLVFDENMNGTIIMCCPFCRKLCGTWICWKQPQPSWS